MPDKIIELKPIKESSEDWDAIEVSLKMLFKREVYWPILRELGETSRTLKNSLEDVSWALQTGRISYYRGVFSGKFNAQISKELKRLGATWDRKASTWNIPQSKLPMELRNAISSSESRFQQRLDKIDRKLAEVLPEQLAEKVSVSKFFDRAIWKVSKEFDENAKGLVVPPNLSPKQRAKIAEEWNDNMKLWIKDWTEKEITELRVKMQKTIFAGNRYEAAIKTIQTSYGVTANKAKFLARQETGLLMAKFKETRYQDAGVDEYKWGCVAGSKNHPVRPWHKALEGKTFRFDKPPVTTKPGEAVRRNNPGEDYNCRCFARPVVRFKT